MSIASSGKLKSKQHKNALSLAHTGKILSDSHKENIRKAITGKSRTDESKEKYSKSKLGIKNPSSRLNETDVKEIKLLFIIDEFSDVEIANMYSVHRKTINDIKLNRTWTHIIV